MFVTRQYFSMSCLSCLSRAFKGDLHVFSWLFSFRIPSRHHQQAQSTSLSFAQTTNMPEKTMSSQLTSQLIMLAYRVWEAGVAKRWERLASLSRSGLNTRPRGTCDHMSRVEFVVGIR